VQVAKYINNVNQAQGSQFGDRASTQPLMSEAHATRTADRVYQKVRPQQEKISQVEEPKPSRKLRLQSKVGIAILLLCLAGGGVSIYAYWMHRDTRGQPFAERCKQKHTLSKEIRTTIDVLLEVAGTQDCNNASKKLLPKTELDLGEDSNPLVKNYFKQHPDVKTLDLKPIAYLTNLKILNLSDIELIEDISPLRTLTNLEVLNLRNTTVNNQLSSLKELPNLTELNLSKCYITDVTPLASLKKVSKLNLSETNITDIRPLASLSNLTELNLSNIEELKDVSALSSLKNLTRLDLSGTIKNKTCPIAETPTRKVCIFSE
jgi:internalin A